MKNVTALGKMTIFYVPSHKLDAPSTVGEQTARARIHDFLMQHYKAYTHTPSPVKGFWLSRERVVLHDVLERFEVSFGSESALSPPRAFPSRTLPHAGGRSYLSHSRRTELSGKP